MPKIDIDKWVRLMIENFPDFKEQGRIPMLYKAALKEQGLEYRHGKFISVCDNCSNTGGCSACHNFDKLVVKPSGNRIECGKSYKCIEQPFYSRRFTIGKTYRCDLIDCLADDRNEDRRIHPSDLCCFEAEDSPNQIPKAGHADGEGFDLANKMPELDPTCVGIWHDACDFDDLPELGRPVLAMTNEGVPKMACRPVVEKNSTYEAVLYGVGKWNVPNLMWWADIPVPEISKCGRNKD